MSERVKRKRSQKLLAPAHYWGASKTILFSMKIGSQGHVVGTFSDKPDKVSASNGAIKEERGKRMKEWHEVTFSFTAEWVKA